MEELLKYMSVEFSLTILLFVLLFIKLGKTKSNNLYLGVAQVFIGITVILAFLHRADGNLFGDMYHVSPLIMTQKAILGIAVFAILFLFDAWFKKHEHLPEFLMLMVSSLLGMFLLISSNNLLMFYLALELGTIPIAAMANFDLEKKVSSEAAMKMILSSAFSSGILLFGISLVYGANGSISYEGLAQVVHASPLQVLAFLFLFTAFAFKLSIVPFHLWTADVYEGSPVAVSAYLSIVSKGAMAFVLINFLYKIFAPLQETWYWMLVILAVATMIIGNLFALRQNNLKRFLAFSSIAQVGFILVALTGGGNESVASVIYFVFIYLFSNLAAFGVVGVISAATGKEGIDDYRGMYKNNPILSWVLAIALFSLAGIPPTAGFFGKFFLLGSGALKGNYTLIIIAALNMIVSLYYYLRVVRSVFMDKNETPLQPVEVSLNAKIGLMFCTAGIVITGLLGWIYEHFKNLVA